MPRKTKEEELRIWVEQYICYIVEVEITLGHTVNEAVLIPMKVKNSYDAAVKVIHEQYGEDVVFAVSKVARRVQVS